MVSSLFHSSRISALKSKPLVITPTRVCPKTQLIIASLTGNAKEVVLGGSWFSGRIFKIHTKSASCFCQTVNLVLSEPELATLISEASFVVVPAAVEINRAVQSLLEHCSPPTAGFLVAEHIKRDAIVGINRVNTTDSLGS